MIEALSISLNIALLAVFTVVIIMANGPHSYSTIAAHEMELCKSKLHAYEECVLIAVPKQPTKTEGE